MGESEFDALEDGVIVKIVHVGLDVKEEDFFEGIGLGVEGLGVEEVILRKSLRDSLIQRDGILVNFHS